VRAGFGLVRTATPEYLRFAAQFGAEDILLNNAALSGAGGDVVNVDADQLCN
jgi:hypothetical protein